MRRLGALRSARRQPLFHPARHGALRRVETQVRLFVRLALFDEEQAPGCSPGRTRGSTSIRPSGRAPSDPRGRSRVRDAPRALRRPESRRAGAAHLRPRLEGRDVPVQQVGWSDGGGRDRRSARVPGPGARAHSGQRPRHHAVLRLVRDPSMRDAVPGSRSGIPERDAAAGRARRRRDDPDTQPTAILNRPRSKLLSRREATSRRAVATCYCRAGTGSAIQCSVSISFAPSCGDHRR